MPSEETAATPGRGRPRSEKARNAILEAAAELLLLRGLGAMSMDAVAESAGVSKATIYRWWPSKEMLALDALVDWAAIRAPTRDTGSLGHDGGRGAGPAQLDEAVDRGLHQSKPCGSRAISLRRSRRRRR